jgi:hypothetical protein
MDINNISSISCETRNNYNKNVCTNLNPDKINIFSKPYENDHTFFDINKFSLEDESNKLSNISKNKCFEHCIDNNYQGFTYNGDKNKCFLYTSQIFDKKIDDNLSKYNLKTFLKTKDSVNIKKIEDQLDSSKYFTESNNYGFVPNNFIKELDVTNQKDCMDSCVKDNNKCKYILYAEKPKECIFYNKKKMKLNKNNSADFDIYTIKSKKLESHNKLLNNLQNEPITDNKYYYCNFNNNKCTIDYTVDKNRIVDDLEIPDRSFNTNLPLYNCSGLYSTNPFCTKEYNKDDHVKAKNEDNDYYSDCFNDEYSNSIEEKKINFNRKCSEKYGHEYIFDDNIFDIKSVIKCEDENIKVKCKLNFNGIKDIYQNNSSSIEHFSTENEKCKECINNAGKKQYINDFVEKQINIMNYSYISIVYLLFFIFIFIYLIYIISSKK